MSDYGTELIQRPTIEALYRMKRYVLDRMDEFQKADDDITEALKEFGGYSPIRIDWNIRLDGENIREKYVDQVCWLYLVKLFHLKKYMLCTEYDKMDKSIAQYQTPDFTPENAAGWLDGLKATIYDNVRTMLKSVYDKLINGHYYVGSGYRPDEKKRNNNGIDEWFILHTRDYNSMYGWRPDPTVTDDLEKACYILDGKAVPDITIKERMRADNALTGKNDYFEIRVCKNGNTHYRIFDDTRRKLNLIGPDGNIIGEKIKIKIFKEAAP